MVGHKLPKKRASEDRALRSNSLNPHLADLDRLCMRSQTRSEALSTVTRGYFICRNRASAKAACRQLRSCKMMSELKSP
jgi:hypothetical protein